MKKEFKGVNVTKILESVQRELEEHGIDFDLSGIVTSACGKEGDGHKVKVVCVSPGLKDSMEELGSATRGNVVMVRVDEETLKALDAWVETGAVKSRSEAAALFIREGLKVREGEIDRMREALREVEEAKERLRKKAREVFGEDSREGE